MITGPSCHPGIGITGYGAEDAQVALVGIAPGRTEVQTGRPFSGVSGRLLDGLLEACGWPREKTYATNLLCWYNDAPLPHEVLECWPRLEEELLSIKPKLIVPLGMLATQQFVPDRKFGTVRGTLAWSDRFQCRVMPTYHPAAVLHAGGEAGYGIVRDIVRDLTKIRPWIEGGFPNPLVQWTTVGSREEAQRIFASLPRKGPAIAVDVETLSLKSDEDEIDVHTDDLLCLALSDGNATWVFTPDLLQGIEWPNDVAWTGHFSIFDKQAILRHLGVDIKFRHDTLNMHYCLDERSRGHALKLLAREYVGAGFYEESLKTERRKGNLDAVPFDKVKEYNAYDTAYTARLANVFMPKVREDNTEGVYRMMMDASDIFARMQYHGVHVSVDRINELALEWLPLWLEKEAELQRLYLELGGEPRGDGGINLNSPLQLSKFLFGTLKLPGGPSTKEEVLELLKDEHPFVDGLLDLRELDKLISVYINGVKDDIKRTGRLHPTPKLHGTNTGRLSYTDPPVQTIPRPYSDSIYGPKLRRLFTAKDDDHVIIEADLRQAEVWMAWFYSGDPTMLADLQSGDFHTQTAMFITEKPAELVTKAERSDAKRMTFGRFFLIGDGKFARQAKKSLAEARAERERWEKRYARYPVWVEETFRNVQRTGEQRTVTGRVQRYPYIFDTSPRNKICNFPIQSTSHDVLLAAIIDLYHPLLRNFDAHIMLDVHDAMIVECPHKHAMEAAHMISEVLSKPRFGVPSIPCEVKIGNSWGEVVEVDIN